MACAQRSGRYSRSLASVRVACGRTGVSCGPQRAQQRRLQHAASNSTIRAVVTTDLSGKSETFGRRLACLQPASRADALRDRAG
eukprot:COSAG06_NODE_30176_length_543_cov_1.054054_1_plen_83_part_10